MLAAPLLACALNVAPVTMDAVVQVESGGRPLALHVNHLSGSQPQAVTLQEAVAMAERYMKAGYSVDLGLAQINSRNLASLGYSVADAFDPCKNLAGGAAILTADYGAAVARFGEGQIALQAALSAYNTGDFYRGAANGYVARYFSVPAGAILHAPQIIAVAVSPRTADTEVW
jgi:type IV secretion system protein VirB1